jgi:hypothetical protein
MSALQVSMYTFWRRAESGYDGSGKDNFDGSGSASESFSNFGNYLLNL